MKFIKRMISLTVAVFMLFLCLSGIFSLTMLLKYADFQKGKLVVIGICLLVIVVFGLAAFKCCKWALHREETSKSHEIELFPVMDTVKEEVSVQTVPEVRTERKLALSSDTGISGAEIRAVEEPCNIKKELNDIDGELQQWVGMILARSFQRKTIAGKPRATTEEENAFFRELIRLTLENNLNPNAFYFEPMSNRSIHVQYRLYPIGRIKLNGRKTYMQVLKGLFEVEEYYDLTLEEYVSYLPDWIRHIKYCLRD